MTFDEAAVVALVTDFCRRRRVDAHSRIRAVANLDAAFDVVTLKGPDARWRTIVARHDPDDVPGFTQGYVHAAAERAVYHHAFRQYDRRNLSTLTKRQRWFLSHTVVSSSHWARLSQTIRSARDHGLGWLVPANKDLLLVPRPVLRCLEQQPRVLHSEAGRMAVEWPDGTGFYYLRGVPFDKKLYFEVINSELTLDQVAGLGNADHRSIALSYLNFEQLVTRSNARILDVGVKGTTLYRLFLPRRIAGDRVRGYGRYDYFIHMRDASHPEREFIEWVDPAIAAQGNAELCQAHAFGITLDQWLSIEQQG
jgi:hypothetical protein